MEPVFQVQEFGPEKFRDKIVLGPFDAHDEESVFVEVVDGKEEAEHGNEDDQVDQERLEQDGRVFGSLPRREACFEFVIEANREIRKLDSKLVFTQAREKIRRRKRLVASASSVTVGLHAIVLPHENGEFGYVDSQGYDGLHDHDLRTCSGFQG
jgi:hypothetical protein